jgi:hypothetical protein
MKRSAAAAFSLRQQVEQLALAKIKKNKNN